MNPTKPFNSDNGNHKALQTLSVLEANKLLDALLVDTGTLRMKQLGIRNYTIGLLMLDAGLRVGEVIKLTMGHLSIAGTIQQTLEIDELVGKRGRERTIPLSSRIRKAVENLRTNVWSFNTLKLYNYAFYSIDPLHPLTTRQIQRIICQAANQAISRCVHPHVLRHTFATMLMRTTSIRVVQELLGHKNLSSTQVYTHPNTNDLKNAIDSLENADVT